MLKVTIPAGEFYDSKKNEFIYVKEHTLTMEHSLVSISKWEAKWHIPFINGTNQKTAEQILDYIRFMTLTQNVDPNVYLVMPDNVLQTISDYIEDPMTATTFKKNPPANPHQIVTSEVVYYQMIALGIPMEFQKWHFNRLQTLIRVVQEKSNGKQMSKSEIYKMNSQLNAARRAKFKTKG